MEPGRVQPVEEGLGDLVISDVIMPDGNGLDALPRITRLRPGLPVIVISAQNTIMKAIQATEAEAWATARIAAVTVLGRLEAPMGGHTLADAIAGPIPPRCLP